MRALNDDEQDELDDLVGQGMALLLQLGLAPDDPSDLGQVAAAVDAACAVAPVTDDAAFALGCLWGDALCSAKRWEWWFDHDRFGVGPKKGPQVFPADLVRGWLGQTGQASGV